jgi:hypothetical protein
MKNLKTILIIIILIFSINSTYAQYGNSGYGGGYGNQGYGQGGYGGGRMNQMSQDTHSKPEVESEKSKKERLDKVVTKLKTDLTLDELQVFAVQGVLVDSMKKQELLFKKEEGQEEKIIEIQALSETTDRKILEFLNKDQKKKYIEMTADRKEKMQEMIDKGNR